MPIIALVLIGLSDKAVTWPSNKLRDTSDFGVQVRIKLIVDISLRWSFTFWATVLYACFKALLTSIFNLGGSLMTLLKAVVLVGAALVPGLGR